MTAGELLDVLNQQWATVKDIRLIGKCGNNKALKYKKEIADLVKTKTGKECPYGLVPMEYVILYFGINIKFLKKISK